MHKIKYYKNYHIHLSKNKVFYQPFNESRINNIKKLIQKTLKIFINIVKIHNNISKNKKFQAISHR